MSDMVTVQVEGALGPTRKTLPQAIVLAWQTLRALPLGEDQLADLRRLFGSGAEERIRAEIRKTGKFEVCFLPLGGLEELQTVQITPVGVLTALRR
ncbi:hypothetical protein [Kitasatospora sp. NBC_00315]|uniref:hypothetical protein n=1 Tax=Kitasatospora sp. NBC_00315 TaxID=2975963 RepID=UPI00324F6BE5